jgi:hypothetical protein
LRDVARGHRLGEHLALFELVDRLDAAQEGVLQRGRGGLRGRRTGDLDEERVLVVAHAWARSLRAAAGRRGCVVDLVFVLRAQ